MTKKWLRNGFKVSAIIVILLATSLVTLGAWREQVDITYLYTNYIKPIGIGTTISIGDSGDTVTVAGTGNITAANIADPTRSFNLPLAGAAIDGGDDIDDASAPDITTLDNIPAILWDNSGETAAVQWTFRLPSDFSSGLIVYALVSSNDASGAGTILDWAVAVNTDDTGFASPTAQTQVACTSATLDASNEVLTLTSDATAEALYSAGTWVTLELFNASTNDDDLELKGVDVTYTATM